MNKRLGMIIALGVLLLTSAMLVRSAQRRARSNELGTVEREPERTRPVMTDDVAALEGVFDLDGLSLVVEHIRSMHPKDVIPALTDPPTRPLHELTLPDDERMMVLATDASVVAASLTMLSRFEIANMMVGQNPVALTYCPVCDSVAAFSRSVTIDGVNFETLEFGVSGALYAGNLLLYDRTTSGLWSQLSLRAVSGPYAGTSLPAFPVQVMTAGLLRTTHPNALVVDASGIEMPEVGRADLESESPSRVGVLGLGVLAGSEAYFVPASLMHDGYTLNTSYGSVEAEANDAGVLVRSAAPGLQTVQTLRRPWVAIWPACTIVGDESGPG